VHRKWGKKVLDWVIEKGWEILNECTRGDWEGGQERMKEFEDRLAKI